MARQPFRRAARHPLCAEKRDSSRLAIYLAAPYSSPCHRRVVDAYQWLSLFNPMALGVCGVVWDRRIVLDTGSHSPIQNENPGGTNA